MRLLHTQSFGKHPNIFIPTALHVGMNIPLGNQRSKPTVIGDILPINRLIIENPKSGILTEIGDIFNERNKIEAPTTSNKSDKMEAARLIVIRRRKMKKHKLKKLRKKMKFEWAKVRQRREMRKEKAFQAKLIHQIKVAEAFSAEKYVEDKLRQAADKPLPRYWKGRRLPAFIIKEKLGIK